jgi:hypothetical protein
MLYPVRTVWPDAIRHAANKTGRKRFNVFTC